MMKSGDVVPVILAGGMDKRLRPLTGHDSPKPFLKIFSKKSLFQNAVLQGTRYGAPVIVCHEAYLDHVQAQLAEIDVEPLSIILEPAHKGTAIALALAAFSLKNQKKCMLVIPSDHVLGADGEDQNFEPSVDASLEHANDSLILFGVKPRAVESGYSYIVTDEDVKNIPKIKKFIERPKRALAKKIIESENCYWNTRVLLVRPRVYLELLNKNESEIYRQCERSFYAHDEQGVCCYPETAAFLNISPTSLHAAISKHCDNIRICLLSCYWSDVGTWPKLLQVKMQSLLKSSS